MAKKCRGLEIGIDYPYCKPIAPIKGTRQPYQLPITTPKIAHLFIGMLHVTMLVYFVRKDHQLFNDFFRDDRTFALLIRLTGCNSLCFVQ